MGGKELIMQGMSPWLDVQPERILVSVRVRPLNEKEIAANDTSDWEYVNENTIMFKHAVPDRAMYPTSYTYDRVFGSHSRTREVYEEGARDIALSAVSGINSSLFAYGQTSSGKTYTMSGITEYAMADIFNYIYVHKEREFVLKFSAIEIYNEAVRDLLSSDSSPLRLLDDPEKGTVVERLTEVTLRDWNNLQELLSICEAQRKIGETSLNETSSRSHQILRLTIESSPRGYIHPGHSSTLAAQVNFVDLAGSERASQTSSAGARLKEGCHINRSLLTLGTVIRKLSKGIKGHIPYRDSKLTRILQNSIGGNARTAIICTMSPAHSHVEQSRNTLLFASCAKEVTTNAKVNLVMSDKAMVKRLQRELARLESELKTIVSNSIAYDFAALLKEKDRMIEKMDQQIKELTRQCQLAHCQIEDRQHSVGQDQVSRGDENHFLESSEPANPLYLDLAPRAFCTTEDFGESGVSYANERCQPIAENPEDNFPLEFSAHMSVGPHPYQVWEKIGHTADAESEDSCKEVRCVEVEESQTDQEIESPLSLSSPEEKIGQLAWIGFMNEDAVTRPQKRSMNGDVITSPQKRDVEAKNEDVVTLPKKGAKEAMNEDVTTSQKRDVEVTNEDVVTSPKKGAKEAMNEDAITSPQILFKKVMNEDTVWTPENGTQDLSRVNIDYTYDDLKEKIQSMQKAINCLISFCPSEQSPSYSEAYTSTGRSLTMSRSRSCRAVLVTMPPAEFEKNLPRRSERPQKMLSSLKFVASFGSLSRKTSPNSLGFLSESQHNSDKSDSEDDQSVVDFSVGVDEEAKTQSQKEFDDLVLKATPYAYELRENRKDAGVAEMHASLQPASDWPVQFERQRREIIQLWDVCNTPLVHRTYFFLLFKGDPSDSVYIEVELRRLSFLKDTYAHGTSRVNMCETVTPESSAKALYQERKKLSKEVPRKFSKQERERIYLKWGVRLNSKRRSQQLAGRLWTDTKDMDHIKKSAALVACLVGFLRPSQVPKEIFGLTFLSQAVSQRSFMWKHSLSTLS